MPNACFTLVGSQADTLRPPGRGATIDWRHASWFAVHETLHRKNIFKHLCTIKLHKESTESRWRELREQCSSWLYAAFCLHSHNPLDVTHKHETIPCQMLPDIDITFMTLPGFIRFLQFSIFIPGYFFWIWDSIMVSQAWAKHAPRAVGHLGCAARLPEVTTMGCFKMKLYQTYLYSQFVCTLHAPNFSSIINKWSFIII